MYRPLRRIATGFLAAALTVVAAPVVDITVPAPYDFGAVVGTGQWSQSFTAESENAAGAGIWIFSTPDLAGQAGTVELRLFEDLPTAGGSALATGTANISLANAGQFYDVVWSSPVATTVGGTYYLQILHTLPTGAAPTFAGNTYAGGNAFQNSAAFVNFDAPIRIWTEANGNGGPTNGEIPEPGAFALLAGGLAVLAAMKTRRGADAAR